MISFEGKRTRLRPIRKADMEKSIIWRNDPEIRENTQGYRFPVTEQMEDRWYQSAVADQSHTRVTFAIEELAENKLIGFIHLNRLDWISRNGYFGITIGEKAYQGQGMGGDSMITLFNYAFDCLNLRKICLEVAAYNRNAISLYKRFGFSEEGVLKEQIYFADNYHDLILMRIFASDFKKKYSTV